MLKRVAAAAAGAAVGYLCCTPQGRRMARDGYQKMHSVYDDCLQQMRDFQNKKMVESSVNKPHPDTAMANAFEQATGT